jgi:hypothetical protein
LAFVVCLAGALFGLAVGLSMALTMGLRAQVAALRQELLWAKVRISRLEAPGGGPATPDDR